jgi:hypothetical protein
MAIKKLDDLVATVERLPEDKAQEVLDFAQFLLHQSGSPSEDQSQGVAWENDPLWDIVGLGESGVGDVSAEHDKYLYGEGHSCKTTLHWQLREKDES